MNPLAKRGALCEVGFRHPKIKVAARGLVVSQCWLVVGVVRMTETDRDSQRQTETDRDRQRQTETDRDR